jgi:predicted  nucleic acid-binding Zn-ribbon protein
MSDDLLEWLDCPCSSEVCLPRTAKAHIEEQAAEIERLKKAIKIQASAVRTLQANEDTEINILRKQKREWHQAVLSLDSEREANAILTTEIEQWKVDYDCAMMDVERLREALERIARLRTDLSGDFSLGSHQSDIARAALAGKAEQ